VTDLRTDVTTRICDYLAERFPHLGGVAADTPLLSSGAIDSLGILDLMMFLAETYGLPMDDLELTAELLETPASLADFVLSRHTVPS